MNAQTLAAAFDRGHDYESYLATDPGRAEPWRRIGTQVGLTDDQQSMLAGFGRDMKVLVVSGIWCGDCAQQGPLIQAVADGSDCIDLRWCDRDAESALASELTVNAGARVPVAIFMAEDHEPVSAYGDRSLTRYRAMAAAQLGGGCPLPGAPVPDDELAGTLQDWLDEFERVQLLLRLSGRLRQMHGD